MQEEYKIRCANTFNFRNKQKFRRKFNKHIKLHAVFDPNQILHKKQKIINKYIRKKILNSVNICRELYENNPTIQIFHKPICNTCPDQYTTTTKKFRQIQYSDFKNSQQAYINVNQHWYRVIPQILMCSDTLNNIESNVLNSSSDDTCHIRFVPISFNNNNTNNNNNKNINKWNTLMCVAFWNKKW
eukprot:167711_1